MIYIGTTKQKSTIAALLDGEPDGVGVRQGGWEAAALDVSAVLGDCGGARLGDDHAADAKP